MCVYLYSVRMWQGSGRANREWSDRPGAGGLDAQRIVDGEVVYQKENILHKEHGESLKSRQILSPFTLLNIHL